MHTIICRYYAAILKRIIFFKLTRISFDLVGKYLIPDFHNGCYTRWAVTAQQTYKSLIEIIEVKKKKIVKPFVKLGFVQQHSTHFFSDYQPLMFGEMPTNSFCLGF